MKTTALAGATLALASLGLTAVAVGASPAADRAVSASGPTYVHQAAFAGTDADVHAVTTASGSTNVTLRLSGLPEAVRGTSLGAHLHTKACGPLAADSGGHYQDPGAAPGTPLHDREVWLDVDVNPAGNAELFASADFAVVPGARSVVVHALPTNHHDGTAGARLLCIDVPFRRDPVSRRSGASLLVGGALSLAFHVLYQVGHGPTEHNEQGVVLGLTNDQWSYLGFIWAGLVAVGVCGLVAADPERHNLRIVRLVLLGLLLGWMSSFLWVLYVPAQLLLVGSRAWLAIDAGRRRILPLWATVPTLVAVAAWLLLPIDADRVYEMHLGMGPWQIQYDDVLGALSVAAWIALGAGLVRRAARTQQPVTLLPAPWTASRP